MLIDGILKTRFPNDRQKLLKSDWRDRYCVLEKSPDDGFVISIYKCKNTKPSVTDRGTFRMTIELSPSAIVTVEDQVNKTQPFFRYIFHLYDGSQYKFSALDLAQRDAWVTTIKDCITVLKRRISPEEKSSSVGEEAPVLAGGESCLDPTQLRAIESTGQSVPVVGMSEVETAVLEDGLDVRSTGDSSRTWGPSTQVSPSDLSRPTTGASQSSTALATIGGRMEPVRLAKHAESGSTSVPPTPFSSSLKPSPSGKLTAASASPGHLDTPVFALSPPGHGAASSHMSSSRGRESSQRVFSQSAPFWMSGGETQASPLDITTSAGPVGASGVGRASGGYDFSRIVSKLSTASVSESESKSASIPPEWSPKMVAKTESLREQVTWRQSLTPAAEQAPIVPAAQSVSAGQSRTIRGHRDQDTAADTQDTTSPSQDMAAREVAVLTKLNNELNDTIEAMATRMGHMESKAQSQTVLLETQVEQLQSKCRDLEKDNQTLQQKIDHMKVDLREMQLLHQEKEGQILYEKAEMLDLQTYKHLAETLTRENSELKSELNALRRNLSSEESMDKKSQKSIKLLLDNIKYLEQEKSRSLDMYGEQKAACEELRADREQLVGKLNEVIRRYKLSDMELRALQIRVQDEVQEEVASETSRLYQLQEDKDRLEEELRSAQQECRLKVVENMRLEGEAEELKDQVRSLSRESEHKLIESLRAQVESLSQELGEKDFSLTASSSRIAKSQLQVDSDRARLSDLQIQVDLLRDEKSVSDNKLKKANSELSRVLSDLKDSERMCAIHKERVLKLERENAHEFDARSVERQTQVRTLREVEESLESAVYSNKLLQDKHSGLERDYTTLRTDLAQVRERETALAAEMETLRTSLSAESKALQKANACIKNAEDNLASVRREQERDREQYQEKLLRLKTISGQRKQSLHELTEQLRRDRSAKDGLSADLQHAEEKCQEINEEVRRLKETRKRELKDATKQNEELKQSLAISQTQISEKEKELQEALGALSERESKLRMAHKAEEEWKKWDKGLRANLLEKEQALEDATKLVTELQQEAEGLNAAVMEKQEAVSKYKKRVNELKQVLMDTTRAKEQAEHSLQGALVSTTAKERELVELSAEKKDCEGRLAKKCLELDGALGTIASLNADLKSALNDLSTATAETTAQKQTHHSLEEAIRSSDKCMESLNGTCRSLRDELDASRRQIADLTQTVDQLRRDIGSRDAQLVHKAEELSARQAEVLSMGAELAAMTAANNKGTTEMDSLRQQVRDMQLVQRQLIDTRDALALQMSTTDELREMVHDLHEEKESLEQSCKDNSSVIESLKRDLDSAREHEASLETLKGEHESEMGLLRSTTDSQKNELYLQLGELESTHAKLVEVDSKLLNATSEIDTLRGANVILREENSSLRSQIDLINHDADLKLASTRTHLDDQIESLYARVTTMMADKCMMDSAVKRAVHQLCESHVWSLSAMEPCDETLSPSENAGMELATKLEQCAGHISSDLTTLRRTFEILQKEVSSIEDRICDCNAKYESAFVTLPDGVCHLDELEVLRPDRHVPGLAAMAARITLVGDYSLRSIQFRERVIHDVVVVFEGREEALIAEYEQKLDTLGQEREEEVGTLKDSLVAISDDASSLRDRLQTLELDMCRCIREKEEVERQLRLRISPEEFEALFQASERSMLEVHGGTFDGVRLTRQLSSYSEPHLDDFDDLSSCQGHSPDRSDRAPAGTASWGSGSPARDLSVVDAGEGLNISDITTGMASNTSLGLSFDRGGEGGGTTRHSQSNSRRSRGASVPLNRKGLMSFVSPASSRFGGHKVASPSKHHVNARLSDVLAQHTRNEGRSSNGMNMYFES